MKNAFSVLTFNILFIFMIEYNSDKFRSYRLSPCFDNLTYSGPVALPPSTLSNNDSSGEMSDDDMQGGSPNNGPTDDHYALLVKAWEQKVFPTIRRRFRNEAERKEGLEQIRGALQLGV